MNFKWSRKYQNVLGTRYQLWVLKDENDRLLCYFWRKDKSKLYYRIKILPSLTTDKHIIVERKGILCEELKIQIQEHFRVLEDQDK